MPRISIATFPFNFIPQLPSRDPAAEMGRLRDRNSICSLCEAEKQPGPPSTQPSAPHTRETIYIESSRDEISPLVLPE